MILGWIQRDGMARMRVTGVVPTQLSGACISWDLLVNLNYYGMSEILTQLLSEQCAN